VDVAYQAIISTGLRSRSCLTEDCGVSSESNHKDSLQRVQPVKAGCTLFLKWFLRATSASSASLRLSIIYNHRDAEDAEVAQRKKPARKGGNHVNKYLC